MLSQLEFPRPIEETPVEALLEAYEDGYEPIIQQGQDGEPDLILGFAKAGDCTGGDPDALAS